LLSSPGLNGQEVISWQDLLSVFNSWRKIASYISKIMFILMKLFFNDLHGIPWETLLSCWSCPLERIAFQWPPTQLELLPTLWLSRSPCSKKILHTVLLWKFSLMLNKVLLFTYVNIKIKAAFHKYILYKIISLVKWGVRNKHLLMIKKSSFQN